MAVRTLFYPDGETVYQASDFMAPWGRLLSNGVFSQGDFNISADLAVSVSAGCAKVSGGGYIVVSDSTVSVPIEANTSGYNRLDGIVIEVDSVNNKTSIKAVKGIPSSSPVPPALASNQLPLAAVYVGNNASAIDDNTVRTFVDGYIGYIDKDDGTTSEHWAKHSDGTLECWGFVSYHTLTISGAYGSVFWYNDYTHNLPSDMPAFADTPYVDVNTISGGLLFAFNETVQNGKTLHFSIMSPQKVSNLNFQFTYHIKGRWK
ncbi:MAG TPA: hypothetical protein DG942_01615 [Ruminococcaceae bacterium]|mgnify:FL=1|jgi:hypothetical protein|nr:hypothetical protein [Oscillospiraceae bacterium]